MPFAGLWLAVIPFLLLFLELGATSDERKWFRRREAIDQDRWRRIANIFWDTSAEALDETAAEAKVAAAASPKRVRNVHALGEGGYECTICWDNCEDLSAFSCGHVFCTPSVFLHPLDVHVLCADQIFSFASVPDA